MLAKIGANTIPHVLTITEAFGSVAAVKLVKEIFRNSFIVIPGPRHGPLRVIYHIPKLPGSLVVWI